MSGAGPVSRLAVVRRTTTARVPDRRGPAHDADPALDADPAPEAPRSDAAALDPAATTQLEAAPGAPDALLSLLPAGPALLVDTTDLVVAATDGFARLAQAAPEQLVGRPVDDLLVVETAGDAVGERALVLRTTGHPVPVRLLRWDTLPGTTHRALLLVDVSDLVGTAAPVPGAVDALTVDALAHERRRRRASEAAARDERRRLEDVARIARLGSWELDLARDEWALSPELRAMLGVPAGCHVSSDVVARWVHPGDRGRIGDLWDALLVAGLPLEVEFRVAGEPGRVLHVRAARLDDRGPAGVVVGTVEDVTGRRSDEIRMRTTAQRFTDLLAVAPVGIALFDDDERLLMANQALCRLLGQGQDALRARRADELLDLAAEAVEDPTTPATPLLARPAGSAGSISWSCPARALHRRERGAGGLATDPVWCELHVSVSTHEDGSVTHLVVFTDVTETRRVQETLRHQALHDELTGLPNRRALSTTVSHLLHGPTARRTAVLFCDLDNFKRVNDSLGHDAGDELLVELATRLRDRLPSGCSATRVSGDEFVVVCADVDLHGGLDALTGAVAAILRTAVAVHGQLVRVSATVGAAVGATVGLLAGPGDADTPAVDPAEDPVTQVLRLTAASATAAPGGAEEEVHPRTGDLMRFADAALFEAKSGGAGRFALADEAIMRGADEALRIESQLRQAMLNDELVLHFQPVVGPDGRVQTAEALVRWQHPEHGLMFPDKFLPIAEAADLMGDLDRWVLRSAVREAATWPVDADGHAPSIAVNLAGLLPGDPDFLPTVRDTVAEAGLPWDRLVLELVETCLADLPPYTLGEMNELIAAGVRFAVDDFGTGYSSLSRLTGLPAQIVKLDRGFVRGVATGESDRAVARAVVELTAAIGQTCVAEGVEDADQFAVLRDLGVHAYQGWLFARAMPAAAFTELVARGPIEPDDLAG